MRARLEKMQALAEMQGAGKDIKDFLEKSGLAGLMGNRPLRNVFLRLYEDALRRMRQYSEMLEMLKLEGRGPVDLSKPGTSRLQVDTVVSLPQALDMTGSVAFPARNLREEFGHTGGLMDTAPGNKLTALRTTAGSRAFSPDGRELVASAGAPWARETREIPRTPASAMRQPLDSLTPDQRRVVMASPRVRAAENRVMAMFSTENADLVSMVIAGVATPLHSRPATAATLPPLRAQSPLLNATFSAA